MEISEEVSLYEICQGRVCGLVKAGTWNSCSINPFRNLPSQIVDELMAFSGSDIPKISEVLLFLTSAKLSRLHLVSYKFWKERNLFLNVIRTNCFKSLRILTWFTKIHSCIDIPEMPVIKTLIRSCLKLEEFHSDQVVDLNFFENCMELRVLFFSCQPSYCDYFYRPSKLTVLASLKKLQVFFTYDMNCNLTAKILKLCPQLVSLGQNDSLNALEIIHANSKSECDTNCTEIFNVFQLKRCVWGRTSNSTDSDSFISNFPEKVRIAVTLCPSIEELSIYINHKDSIESLKNLKQLIHLKIYFYKCDSDYIPNCLSLFKVMGPKLKYLFIECTDPVPVDIICEYCPLLESLQLCDAFATTSGPDSCRCNIFMKSLRILNIDQNALWFLLSSCKNLVELVLRCATCLENNLLSQILRLNPLSKLKLCDIVESSLTMRGFRMLLETAVSLRRVNFGQTQTDDATMENLITDLNLTNINYGEMFDLPYGADGYIPGFFRF